MSVETDPRKVVCVGEGLHFGYFKHPICATIDTSKAGPGELTVYCNGPENPAYSELKDEENGTFILTVRPQDVGSHLLYVKYNEEDVPGSPFNLRVSAASLLEVKGRGVTSDILKKGSNYEIQIDTVRAGPGSLKVRVGGPRGAFKVQTKKDGHMLRCRYNPQHTGLYVIHIMWDGDDIPGSPYNVFLAKNDKELTDYLNRLARNY